MELPIMINDITDVSYWMWIVTSIYAVALFGYEIVWQRTINKKWPKPIFVCTMLYIACSGWDKYKELTARTLRECGRMNEYFILMASWQWAARSWLALVALWFMLYVLTKRLFNGEEYNERGFAYSTGFLIRRIILSVSQRLFKKTPDNKS